jgi:hypothetical protein
MLICRLGVYLQLSIHQHAVCSSAVIYSSAPVCSCLSRCVLDFSWAVGYYILSLSPGASSEMKNPRSRSLYAVGRHASLRLFPLPPGASSEISESQIALPSFLRLLAEFANIWLSLLQPANYPYAAIYPFAYWMAFRSYLSACWMTICS